MERGRAASAQGTVASTDDDRTRGRSGGLRTDLPYIEARLTLHRSADGGRRTGIAPGYRAHWWVYHLDGECTHNDGPVDLVDVEHLAPGETGRVRILPIAPEFWQDLEVGSKLEMWEGGVVGIATVTSLHL